MEQKQIDVYGIAEQISTHHINGRKFHSFVIKAEMCFENDEYRDIEKTYQVYINDKDLSWDLEDGHKYNVMGFEVAEGIIMAYYTDRWGRYCNVCDAWHIEGYFVGEHEYACSEECALKLYNGDEEAFKSDLAMLDDPDLADEAPTYWTYWD